MRMRRVTWLILVALFALGAFAVAAPADTTMDHSQATVTTETTVVTHGTTAAPIAGATFVCPAGTVAYLPSNEVTITGDVTAAPGLRASGDIDYQMMVRTADGRDVRVWLGPATFLDQANFEARAGDNVIVTGVPVGTSGDILARQVMWHEQTFAFRNAQGYPMWTAPVAVMPGTVVPGTVVVGGGTINPEFARYSEMWNSNQLRTVSGRIDRIESIYPAGEAMGPGLAIRVRLAGMDDDMVPSWQRPPGELRPNFVWVHLGPSWYVRQHLPDLHSGQTVTVTG